MLIKYVMLYAWLVTVYFYENLRYSSSNIYSRNLEYQAIFLRNVLNNTFDKIYFLRLKNEVRYDKVNLSSNEI